MKRIFYINAEGIKYYLSTIKSHTDWLGNTHYDGANFVKSDVVSYCPTIAISTNEPEYWLNILKELYTLDPFTGAMAANFQVEAC